MIPSVIRTWAAMLAAWLLSLPLAPAVLDALGVDTERATQVVTGLVMLAVGWLYYAVARALEHRWPRLGVLLGKVGAPQYTGRPVELQGDVGPLATGGILRPGNARLLAEEGPPGLVIPKDRTPSASLSPSTDPTTTAGETP